MSFFHDTVLYHSDRLLPFLSFFAVMDGIQGVCSGILRGTGNQKLGAIANLFAFYVLGLPMAWVCCFTWKWGVNGLLVGISLGTIFQSTFLMGAIFFRECYIFSNSNDGNNMVDLSSSNTSVSNSPIQIYALEDGIKDEISDKSKECDSTSPDRSVVR